MRRLRFDRKIRGIAEKAKRLRQENRKPAHIGKRSLPFQPHVPDKQEENILV